jgi:HEAT repeat protein
LRGNERVRIAVAEILAFFPGEETVRALRARLEDRSPEMRLTAAIALAELDAVPPLRRLVMQFRDGTAAHSLRFVDLFSRMTDTHSSELLELARDASVPPSMRAAAIEALVGTGDYGLVSDLVGIADAPGTDPMVVSECARALGRLGHPSAATLVQRLLEHPDWEVRAEAAEAAGRMGLVEAAPRLSVLLADDVWPVRFRAGEALVYLGDAGTRVLRRLAVEGTGRTQRTAALVLAERGLA